MTPRQLLLFLPFGFVLTVAVETVVLLLGLARPHSLRRRLFAGVWLNACSYPVVILVLRPWLDADGDHYARYLWAAEVFAPLSECALFAAAFHRGSPLTRPERARDYAAIILANLASFGTGLVVDLWALLARLGMR